VSLCFSARQFPINAGHSVASVTSTMKENKNKASTSVKLCTIISYKMLTMTQEIKIILTLKRKNMIPN
jgi:hypothetical protein